MTANDSVVVLALVTLTASKVRNTDNITNGNDETLWPQPLILWPEYIITAVSGISFAINLSQQLQFHADCSLGFMPSLCRQILGNEEQVRIMDQFLP